MYDHDNLKCMINCLEEFGYEYTKYEHRNGCCTINSDLLLKQLKLNEKEIRNKAIDEFAEKIALETSESIIWDMLATMYKNSSLSDTSDKIVDYVIDTAKEIAEQMKGGAT